jgi:hypothetical protein
VAAVENALKILGPAVAILVAAGVTGTLLSGGSDQEPSPVRPAKPDWAGLPAYQRRCEQLDRVGALGRVVFQPRKEMTRGETNTVLAAVTLEQSLPPARVLHRRGATEEPGVVVSCRVQARLSGSHYDFDIEAEDWIERSLLTTDTARWSWYVTPKIGGEKSLVLQVRPIVKFRGVAGDNILASASRSSVQEYETSVHVGVPWSDRPQETMTRLAATFNVAEGLVKALTGLLVALAALGSAVLGLRFWKKKRQPSTEP